MQFSTIDYVLHNNLSAFTLSITWDKKSNKKKLRFPKDWGNIIEPIINKTHNGLALITGKTFWVLDVDNCWNELCDTVRKTLWDNCKSIVKTKRGYHFYYKLKENEIITNKTNITLYGKEYNAIDIRGNGGCIIAPPSKYRDDLGNEIVYEWVKGNLSLISYAPDEIYNMLKKEEERVDIMIPYAIENSWSDIVDAVNMLSDRRASSYNEWISVIWALKNTECSERSLELAHIFSRRTTKLSQYEPNIVNETFMKGKDGYTCASIFYWAMKDSPEEYYKRFGINRQEENAFNGDIGLAEIFVSENRGKLVCTFKDEYHFEFYMLNSETNIWNRMIGLDIRKHFCSTMRGLLLSLYNFYIKEIDITKDKEKKLLTENKCEELKKIMKKTTYTVTAKNVIPLVASILYDPEFFIKLNRIPRLLSVSNGVVDLKTGELMHRQATHYFTYALKTAFNTEANIELWDTYFNKVFNKNKDIIEWIQMYLGYTITGETILQKIVVFWGSGSNSKSVLLKFLRNLFEALYCSLTPDDLYKTSGNRDTLYNASNARMCVVCETHQDASFDEEILKMISGEDPLSVSAKYKNTITYEPQFKFFIITNNKPKFDSEKDAIWRRVLLVPFLIKFEDSESLEWDSEAASEGKMFPKDNKFIETLMGNLDGLLLWLVKGAIMYYNSNIKLPKSLQEVKNEYKNSCDIYLEWIQNNYEKSNIEFITSETLFEHWKQENQKTKETDKSIKMRIAKALSSMGVIKSEKKIDKQTKVIYYLEKI